jgi:hypothetical protein
MTTVRKQLWLQRETPLARLFWLENPNQAPPPATAGGVDVAWIPRTVQKSILKFKQEIGETGRRCDVEIEAWWWEKFEAQQKQQDQKQGHLL